MTKDEEIRIIEALLFASSESLSQQQVNLVFESDPPNLEEIVGLLNEEYTKSGRSFYIEAIAYGYRLTSKPDYETWIRRLLKKSGRLALSQAALETLAIIAYKQPINRFEIESIRGVDCSGVIKTLLARHLIQIKGRDTSPGRPLLYSTTAKFLEFFGLNKISDMPKLKEMKDLEEENPLDEQINAFK